MKKAYLLFSAAAVLLVGGQAFAQCESATTLVVDLQFENTTADSSQYNQPMFVLGNPTFAMDRHGNPAGALNTSAGTVYLYNSLTGEFKAPFPFTYSGWIKANALNARNPIFMNEDYGNAYSGAWVNVLPTGEVTANVGDGGAPSLANVVTATTVSQPIITGEWFHIAVVFQSLTEIRIYVNGIEQSVNYTGTGSQLYYYMSYGTAGKIGSGVNGTGTNVFFDGLIDDVRFWTTMLVDQQIQGIHNSHVDFVSVNSVILCNEEFEDLTAPNELCAYSWSNGDTDAVDRIFASTLGIGDHVIYASIYDNQNIVYTDSVLVTVSACTGVAEEESAQEVSVYPNPTTGMIVLESNTPTTFQLSNVLGEILTSISVNGKRNFDLSTYAKGVYMLTDNNTGITHRLLKE